MYRAILALILTVGLHFFAQAQADTATAVESPAGGASHYRISLLTCGPGEEVWETFGHACIRVIDSSKTDAERDKIYNYGFFESSEGNSIWSQAFSGRVVDLLDTITFEELMIEYRIKKRSITEQVFELDEQQKELVVAFLKKNLRRENRYYDFDTFYDNCSTRIRDLFTIIFGNRFQYGAAVPKDSRITFRDVTVTTLCPAQHKYWFGFAVNILYASRTDRVMSNHEAMFLPSLLSNGMSDATIDGRKICSSRTVIQDETIDWEKRANQPFYILLLLSVFTICALLIPKSPIPGRIMSTVVLLLTGIAGCLILRWWFMNGEPAWKDNFNVLWALPTNLLVPFLGKRAKRLYAAVAITLLIGALLLHLLRVQIMPVFEISSLLLALLFVFGAMYRNTAR